MSSYPGLGHHSIQSAEYSVSTQASDLAQTNVSILGLPHRPRHTLHGPPDGLRVASRSDKSGGPERPERSWRSELAQRGVGGRSGAHPGSYIVSHWLSAAIWALPMFLALNECMIVSSCDQTVSRLHYLSFPGRLLPSYTCPPFVHSDHPGSLRPSQAGRAVFAAA